MSREIYEDKKHIGDSEFPFWNGCPRIKFCDWYDDKSGTFFHPELPQFHNVTIHMARLFLLKMKKDIPKLYRENIMLTWLSPYKVGYEHKVMSDNFPLALLGLKKQYEHNPFKLIETLDELYEIQSAEAEKIAKQHEQLQKENLKSLKEVEKEITEVMGVNQ